MKSLLTQLAERAAQLRSQLVEQVHAPAASQDDATATTSTTTDMEAASETTLRSLSAEPIHVGAPPDSSQEDTLMARLWREHEVRSAEYATEMGFLHRAGGNYNGREDWAQLMRKVGRK